MAHFTFNIEHLFGLGRWLVLGALAVTVIPEWALADPVSEAPADATPRVTSTDHAPKARKSWEVGATLESHALLIRNDLQGAANNKLVNFLFLYGRWQPTSHDAIELRTYVYERFLADPGETGVRSDDTALVYFHYFDLPNNWKARVYGALTAPTSFTAEKMSLYTAPRLGGALSWQYGPLQLEAIGFGETFWVKYGQMAGGNPNPQWHVAGILNAEVQLPKLPLVLGGSLVSHRYWYYPVGGPPASAEAFNGAVQDRQFASQPMQGAYGAQLFTRWDMPKLAGIAPDFTVAYAQGDSTLGYTSTLHDGLVHSYVFWRTSSQVYAALSAKF